MNGYYHPNFYNSNNRGHKNQYQQNYQHHRGSGGYNGNDHHYPSQYPNRLRTPNRQRAFHDAIYEEEYGSDHEEECCQGRGMSAIFCWLLSVIILIGICASIVLTVFFLLKSKNYMSKNGELDLLFEGENGITFHLPESTTELNSVVDSVPPSSKESSGPGRGRVSSEEVDKKKNGGIHSIFTTTRFPPSRKGPHQIFKESEEDKPLPFQTLYPNGKSTSNERNAILGKYPSTTLSPPEQEGGKTRETGEESSSSEEDSPYLTTTSRPPMQHILFTSPSLSTTTGSRRNLLTTRFPSERTSFTTSTETLDSDSEQDNKDRSRNEDDDESNGYSIRPPTVNYDDNMRISTRGDFVTPSTQDRDDVTYKTEESQLNKMLLEEIPPHGEQGGGSTKKSQEDFKSTEFNLSSSSTDPLARIIKNLAPRWGRNRTVETTTMTSGSHKYDFTISSREKILMKERNSKERKSSKESLSKENASIATSPVTLAPGSSTTNIAGGGYGLNTVQSPDLSKIQDGQDRPAPSSGIENSFLDILVGSEDHKTLVTKETEDGIVTSAILPPWYDTSSAGNNTIFTNTTQQGQQEHESGESEEDSSEQNESSNRDAEQSASSSVLGGIFDFFNKLPINRIRNKDENKPPTDFNQKRIVLKRPGGELLQPQGYNPETEKIPKNETTDEGNNGIGSANIHTILPSNIMTTTIIPDAVVTDEDIRPANNAFHFGSPDGGTNIYGYYPDDDDKDNDKTVEHHMIQSETISDPNELMGSVEEKEPEKRPSHSIELQINSDASSEVVIEQDKAQEEEEDHEGYHPYTRYGETHQASGSEIQKQIVEPPQSMPSPLPTTRLGEGIRRPIINGGESSDLEMKGSESKPVFANTPARNIPPSLIRQRLTPLNNRKNMARNTSHQKTTSNPNLYAPNSSISAEILDNSAEQEPHQEETQDFIRKTYLDQQDKKSAQDNGKQDQSHNQHFLTGSGSFEGGESVIDVSGSGEQPGKWSRPDPNSSMGQQESLEQEHQSSHDDSVITNIQNPSPGDKRDVAERKPIQTLDEALYTGSASIENLENNKVFQVFPVGYSSSTTTSTTTTTERPESEFTISEPDKSADKNQGTDGFVPPTPVNFHENMYTFSPPSSDSIYQSKDGWRPLVYNDGEEDGPTAPAPVPTRPPPHWRDRLMGIARQPVVTVAPIFDLSTAASENSLINQHLSEEIDGQEPDQHDGHHHEEENDSHEKDNHGGGIVSWDATENKNKPQSSEETSKLQFPQVQGHHSESHEPNPNIPQVHQHFHHQTQPQIQRVPMQIPGQQPPQQQIHHQQQFHHQQQHHPQQTPQYQFQSNIDRSKYMMRPAPPPIVMRRTPIQSMGYRHPHSNALPPRPQLIPQVQQQQIHHQNQFNSNNNAPPPEFQHSQQNLVNRRRFKTLGARPRGSVNWPEGKQVVQNTAERRNG